MMKNMQQPRGFTFIETLVAISVLLVSLAGPLSIAAQALSSAHYARDQVVAFYLAQEAIEYVRAVRDQNYLASGSWLDGLSECVDASCTVDFPNFTHSACSGSCSPLLISSTGGLYNQQSGSESPYTRTLTISSVEGTAEIVVVRSTVTWQSAGFDRQIQVTEYLFDWL